MGEVGGKLYFAPGFEMGAVPLEDPAALLEAVRSRIEGFFVWPIRKLEETDETEVGALFAAALLLAALVESVARLDGSFSNEDHPIAAWLEACVRGMDEEIAVRGEETTVGRVFETRFRHALAHQGYVASRGRLTRESDKIYVLDRDTVTVNPFRLLDAVCSAVYSWFDDLSSGTRDIRAFQYRVRELFGEEVEAVREAG